MPSLAHRKRTFRRGDVLFRRGDESESMFIVKSGRVQSVIPQDASAATTTAAVAKARAAGGRLDDVLALLVEDGGVSAPSAANMGLVPESTAPSTASATTTDDENDMTVHSDDGDVVVVVGDWRAGDVVGISALVGSHRRATARVVSRQAELVEVSREELQRVLESEPSLRENLARAFRRWKEHVGESSSSSAS